MILRSERILSFSRMWLFGELFDGFSELRENVLVQSMGGWVQFSSAHPPTLSSEIDLMRPARHA